MKIRNNVTTPWGPPGSEFEVDDLDSPLAWHVDKGTLTVVVEDAEGLSPKQQAVAQAEELGLSTYGSQAQIEERIEKHLAEAAGVDTQEDKNASD
jgi:hypothetical protein